MTSLLIRSFATVGLAGVISSTAAPTMADVLIHGFENSLTSPPNPAPAVAGPNAGTVGFSTTVGVTEGSYSVIVDTNNGGESTVLRSITLDESLKNVLFEQDNPQIAIDVTGLTPGGAEDVYGFRLRMNPDFVDVGSAFNLPGDQSLQQLVFDIPQALVDEIISQEFAQVFLVTNNGGGGQPGMTVTFDNLRIVTPVIPEPSSFAIASLGSLALLRRRSV